MRHVALLLSFCLCALAFAGIARGDDEVQRALAQLRDLDASLEELSLHVERHDLGRLMVFKSAGKAVTDAIGENGLGHMGTMGKYQVMIVAYTHSGEWFTRVATRRTEAVITRLQALASTIADERGIANHSKISEGIFKQMHKLVVDLLDLPLGDALKERLVTLVGPLGQAIAVAAVRGDQHVATIDAGRDVYRRLVALYPDFDAVRVSDAAFSMVINIHGLNEFYSDLTGVD